MSQLALELPTKPTDETDDDACLTCGRGPDGPTATAIDATLVIRDGELQALCVGCEEPIAPADLIIANGLPVTAVGDDCWELAVRNEVEYPA